MLELCVILSIFCYATCVGFVRLYSILFKGSYFFLQILIALYALKSPAALILSLSKFQEIFLAIFDGNFGSRTQDLLLAKQAHYQLC